MGISYYQLWWPLKKKARDHQFHFGGDNLRLFLGYFNFNFLFSFKLKYDRREKLALLQPYIK